jgi:hypothetical protein
MAVDANGKWINPNDTKVVAFDIWDGVGEANKSFLVPKPTTWLAKIAADLRAAFSQFSKFGINPASLLSGNVSLRSLLNSAVGLAVGAARNAALADAKSKFESSVNDEGLVWDKVTGQAAYSSENGTSIDASGIPNIVATQDAISAAEAGAALETFKQATRVLLALKNGSVESFASSATNLIMLGNRINAINEAKENYELDLIDNPDLDASLGSYYATAIEKQNVTFSSPNGSSITKALTTPKQSVTANVAPSGFSSRPVNITEIFSSYSITLKYTPSVIASVTGILTGTVAGETVILERPVFPAALISKGQAFKRETYTNSGKNIVVTQKTSEKYDSIIVRYRYHSSYNPNVKVA